MKIGLAIRAVPARKQFPMKSFAPEHEKTTELHS